jgi:DNA-binding transcriptional MerR regulator
MFKIGDFSKLSRVSVITLRYYDELGLLKPAQVDRFTGYRYYSLDQLPRLNHILALKDLGFSLEETARLLNDMLSPAQMRELLRAKQAEIQQRVAEEQARRAFADAVEEARQLNHDYVGTEHILLGLTREQPSALERAGTTANEVRAQVLRMLAQP